MYTKQVPCMADSLSEIMEDKLCNNKLYLDIYYYIIPILYEDMLLEIDNYKPYYYLDNSKLEELAEILISSAGEYESMEKFTTLLLVILEQEGFEITDIDKMGYKISWQHLLNAKYNRILSVDLEEDPTK